MKCLRCDSVDKFEVSKNVIYCIAEINGCKCMCHLNKAERDKFRSELKKDIIKQSTYKNGIKLNQIADFNEIHRNTARKHISEFDIIPNSNPVRYKFNSKILKENWLTPREIELQKYVEYKPTHYQGVKIHYIDKSNK